MIFGVCETGSKSLAQVFSSLPALKRFILERNHLGLGGAAELTEHLHELHLLESLSVKQNELGFSGLRAIVIGVAPLKNLRYLHLRRHSLGSEESGLDQERSSLGQYFDRWVSLSYA